MLFTGGATKLTDYAQRTWDVVSDSIYNCYSRKDFTLKVAHRLAMEGEEPIGIHSIPTDSL